MLPIAGPAQAYPSSAVPEQPAPFFLAHHPALWWLFFKGWSFKDPPQSNSTTKYNHHFSFNMNPLQTEPL